MALRHPTGIPLDRFLNSFKPARLVIYCDPEGLQDANQDIHSIVKIDAPSIKIQDALDETLKPLGLKLIVKGGMARVTGENEDID